MKPSSAPAMTANGVADPVTIELTVPIEVINLNRRPDLAPIENVVVMRDEPTDIAIVATDIEGTHLHWMPR